MWPSVVCMPSVSSRRRPATTFAAFSRSLSARSRRPLRPSGRWLNVTVTRQVPGAFEANSYNQCVAGVPS